MQLYGNKIWNDATPNSEKSIFTVAKERSQDITKFLDEAGLNYCFYIKDDKATIAIAKFAIDKKQVVNLEKLSLFQDIHFENSPVHYVPKTHIIGNTPYRDIKNRHFQNLNTDLALKVAEKLNKMGIHFSGITNSRNTTLTVNDEDKTVFENIVYDIVNTRRNFSNRIKNIDTLISESQEIISEENWAIVKPMFDRAYYRDENYSSILKFTIENTVGYSTKQLQKLTEIFLQTYGQLNTTSEYFFADTTAIENYMHKIDVENMLEKITYLKGFNAEQKQSIKQLIEKDVPASILQVIDYEFSAENILKIPEIINGNGYNGYDKFIDFVSQIKHIDRKALERYFSLEIYRPDTAKIDYEQYDIQKYSTFKTENGSIYEIPIKTSPALLNRLSDYGVVPKDECQDVYIETNGANWHRIVIPDHFGNLYNNIDLINILNSDELDTFYQVFDEIERIERNKLEHEKNRVTNVEINAPESEKTTTIPPTEKIEAKERVYTESAVVSEFKSKTMESFHLIGGKTASDIELEVEQRLQEAMEEYNIAGEIRDVVLYGSRSRGLESSNQSDIDIVVQIDNSSLKEDSLFNIFNELDIEIGGVLVDINPICPGQTGTLEDYLPKAEAYLSQKQFDINEYDDPDYYEQQIAGQELQEQNAYSNIPIEAAEETQEVNEKQKQQPIQPKEEKSVSVSERSPKERTFAEQVDDVLSGKVDRYSDLKVCDTPQILLDVGCRQLPMMYTRKHLREALKPKNSHTHAHGLDIEQIKMLPELLVDPVMIYDSLTHNDSIIVVTSEIDKDNNPIIASIKPDGKGKYELQRMDSNFITSVYGRENFEKHINRVIAANNLLFISKEKSQSLFSVLGLQSSKGLNSLDFDKIIHQSRNIVNPTIANKETSLPKPDIDSDVDVPPSSPVKAAITEPSSDEHIKTEQLSFSVTSTIPTKNEPDDTVTLDLNKYDDPDYYEQQQIAEQEAADAPKPENFRITDSEIGSGTPLQRFNNNLAAIRLLKELEAEGRQATPEEQETLSRYVGWGGLAEFFKESNPHYQELRDLLTEDEYSSARATTLDSFYTSPVIIDSIYTVLQNAGFKGGNILEPSMGVGNFFGRMPQEMQKQSKLFGVEIDSLTGRIAKQLYPKAHIDIKGFEKTSFKNGSFDVAVGNIPFGDFSLQYDRQSLKIHDYFFMQALDKVKDGGIVAFVTSKGTLDKRDSSFRRQLAEKADLLGAVRLPNTAFKSAGTEVTADIIFLQKRQTPPEKILDWVNIGESAAGLPINEYFVQHPEMVLGEIVQGNKMYGRTDDTMCVPFENSSLSELLPEAVSKVQATFNAAEQSVIPMENSEITVPDGIRNYSYFEYKNNIYTIEDNEVVSLRESWKRSYSPANIERAKAYIQIRDTVRELLAVQQETTPDVEDRIKALQEKLNTQYDSFYKKYGLMHSRFNSQLFRDDSSYPLMLSLEDKVDKDKLIRKSDIFYKRTIRVPEVVDKVDTPQEALVLSLAEKGKVDLEYMSALTDLPQTAIISDLKGDIFPVPEISKDDNIVYQTASEYLSGDIYAKLSAAKYAAESNSAFAENIPALEAAIPTPLTAGEIDIECGATWIPKEIYQQFMYETFKTADEHRADRPPRFVWQQRGRKNIEIDYSPHTNKWNISNKSVDHSVTTDKTYGTKVKNAYTIFEAVLNLHIPNITKTIPDPDDPSKDKKVMDIEATKLVKRKAEAIKKEFKDWIFKDPERRKMLVDLYNRQFNCVRPREYDGSHLQFHGMNASIELHQHQKNAIAHAIYGGNTLFAHCVGAGKTFEMIATAMESKRLGLCSKSLFAVPNHLTEQVGADFMKLYPNANVLIATKQDFTKQNRSKLLAKIATGNYDAVIIGHSQLGMIPISPERQERMYKEQIEDITQGIAELKAQNGESFQVKAMERTRKSLQQKLEKLSSSKKDNTMYFEELGIDKLFVDEAHEFKNLMSVTKLQNVSGISGRTSQRAMELFMKCQYLDEKTGGKGVVFATGTPVSNSITELHTMMRYLQYDFLSTHGMQNFDNWVSVFGKQKTDYELAPTGDKFKARTRIASYANMPELMTMFKQCADVRTADSLKLPVPDCELHVIYAEPTPLQQEMVQELSTRADDVQRGAVEPYEDNMLKITGDGRKVGLDPRLINPTFEDNPNTKLNQCVNNVFKIWQDTAAEKMTQIIFCDLGVPKPSQTDGNESKVEDKSMADIDSLEEIGTFCIYDDIKSKLVEMGVPSNEIAFIHNAKTETQKSELFEKMRSGEIRVLLGSTAKMGTGTNVQDRLIALHDLDVPWRPSDLEQRRGRMVRQGNINEKVHLYRYVTKGTFDAYSYQLLETKQSFISQIITSKTPARTCSDVDQEALTYSEIKALCTGDERIKEKLVLENRVKELNLFQKEYRNTHYELEDKVAAYPEKREQMCVRIEKLEQDFEKCKAIPFDEEGKPVFSMTINGTMYTDRKEAAEALKTALDIVYTDHDRTFPIGEIYGFQIHAAYDRNNECIRGIIKGELEYSVGLSTMPSVNVGKFEKLTIGIEKHLDEARKKLTQADIDIESAKDILAQPFEYAQELAEKTERLSVLTDELNAEATKRLQNAEEKPRTHYFGKGMILSYQKKEVKKQAQERSNEQAKNTIQSKE